MLPFRAFIPRVFRHFLLSLPLQVVRSIPAIILQVCLVVVSVALLGIRFDFSPPAPGLDTPQHDERFLVVSLLLTRFSSCTLFCYALCQKTPCRRWNLCLRAFCRFVPKPPHWQLPDPTPVSPAPRCAVPITCHWVVVSITYHPPAGYAVFPAVPRWNA